MDISLPELLRIFWRRKFVLVGAIVLGAACGWPIANELPHHYLSEGLLLVQGEDQAFPELNQPTPAPATDDRRINTDAAILRSRQLAETAVIKLDYATSDAKSSLLSRARTWIRNQAGLHLEIEASNRPTLNDRIDDFRRRLEVQTAQNSSVIAVRFASPSADISSDAVNTLMQSFVSLDVDARRSVTLQANKWLTERLDALRQDVSEADAKIQAFKSRNNLFSTSQGAVSAVQLSELQTREDSSRQDLARAQAALDSTGGHIGGASSTAQALASPTLQSLRDREANAAQQVATLAKRLGPENPEFQAAQAGLRDLHQQISGEIGRVSIGLRQEVDAARDRYENAQTALNASRLTARQDVDAEVTLAQLTSDAAARRRIYEQFLARAAETQQAAAQFPTAHILSAAVPPSHPAGPSRAVVVMLISLGAALIACAAVCASYIIRRPICSAEELAAITALESVGSLPAMRGRKNLSRFVLDNCQSGIAETLRGMHLSLKTFNADTATDGRCLTVVVTSSTAGDGKTTVASALARSCAADGLRVLLIETDLRQPRLGSTLSLPRNEGGSLESLLEGRSTFDQAKRVDQRSPLHCILADRSSRRPQVLLGSPAFAALIKQARLQYDVIVLDSPPLINVADVALLVPHSDVVLFAVGWQRTPRAVLGEAMRRLPSEARGRTATVLTRVPRRQLGFRGYYAGYGEEPRRRDAVATVG